jgi:NADPH:quinone reductase-like Zn-dependent oxidoreductase
LKVRVDQVFALAEAAKAHEELAGRRTTGKVVLVP